MTSDYYMGCFSNITTRWQQVNSYQDPGFDYYITGPLLFPSGRLHSNSCSIFSHQQAIAEKCHKDMFINLVCCHAATQCISEIKWKPKMFPLWTYLSNRHNYPWFQVKNISINKNATEWKLRYVATYVVSCILYYQNHNQKTVDESINKSIPPASCNQ